MTGAAGTPTPAGAANALLAALPAAELERLRPRLEPITLEHGAVLWEPDEPIGHVYFPTGCLLSNVTHGAPGEEVEAGMVGREGFGGLPLFFGTATDFNRLVCQVPGDALRLRARAFAEAVPQLPGLGAVVARYARAYLGMASQVQLCNALHPVPERAARWVLMARDGVGRDDFLLTQEYLAIMLGVRRATVTLVMGTLQGAGLLTYRRGQLTVLEPEQLQDAACVCLGIIRQRLASARSPVDA